jgi:chromate transporter
MRRELVEKRRWLTLDEFLAGFAVSQVLPGATTVNLAVF